MLYKLYQTAPTLY